MVFGWSKAESPAPEPAAEPAREPSTAADELGQLIAGLGRLGAWIAAANEKVLASLATGQAPARPSLDAEALPTLRALESAIASLGEQVAAATESIRRVQDRVERGFEQLADRLAPAQPPGEAGSFSYSGWEKIVFGPEIASRPALAFQRHQLLNGVLEGDAAACSLAGQLLVFRSAPAERLPPLLKEIGEAYYRWQPKTRPGPSPFEEALAASLQRACETAGLRNRIELVDPGERFDAARHNASARGVEVAEVHGWIVLRDNGKVYTKANVSVR